MTTAPNIQQQLESETVSPKPTRAEVIQAITDEVNRKWAVECPDDGCSPELADQTLAAIEAFVQQSRDADYAVIYPDDVWMNTDQYSVMDSIFEHGAVAEPGSAADTVNRFVTDPAKNELGFLHDQMDAYPHYCTVRTAVSVVPGLPQG